MRRTNRRVPPFLLAEALSEINNTGSDTQSHSHAGGTKSHSKKKKRNRKQVRASGVPHLSTMVKRPVGDLGFMFEAPLIHDLNKLEMSVAWYEGARHRKGLYMCVGRGNFIRCSFPTIVSSSYANRSEDSGAVRVVSRERCPGVPTLGVASSIREDTTSAMPGDTQQLLNAAVQDIILGSICLTVHGQSCRVMQ